MGNGTWTWTPEMTAKCCNSGTRGAPENKGRPKRYSDARPDCFPDHQRYKSLTKEWKIMNNKTELGEGFFRRRRKFFKSAKDLVKKAKDKVKKVKDKVKKKVKKASTAVKGAVMAGVKHVAMKALARVLNVLIKRYGKKFPDGFQKPLRIISDRCLKDEPCVKGTLLTRLQAGFNAFIKGCEKGMCNDIFRYYILYPLLDRRHVLGGAIESPRFKEWFPVPGKFGSITYDCTMAANVLPVMESAYYNDLDYHSADDGSGPLKMKIAKCKGEIDLTKLDKEFLNTTRKKLCSGGTSICSMEFLFDFHGCKNFHTGQTCRGKLASKYMRASLASTEHACGQWFILLENLIRSLFNAITTLITVRFGESSDLCNWCSLKRVREGKCERQDSRTSNRAQMGEGLGGRRGGHGGGGMVAHFGGSVAGSNRAGNDEEDE